ncbi:uncharacterized protein LOC135834669 [Planococcus citri]|uniref:uncharacterized protein LOC135834669 n=1 Tax=Planococcus citri TaxID=170843 RepID=UPI0031F91FA7
MEITRLKTCCCGVFSLRTGSLIILWINLIVGLLLAFLPAYFNSSTEFNSSLNGSVDFSTQYNSNPFKKTTTTPRTEIDLDQWSKEYSLNPRAVEAIRMWSPPTGWILTVTSISAIYGVSKSKPLFVLPFILCSLLITVLLAVVEVAVSTKQFIFCTVAYLLIHTEIFIYFILVLYSHYRIIAGYIQDV